MRFAFLFSNTYIARGSIEATRRFRSPPEIPVIFFFGSFVRLATYPESAIFSPLTIHRFPGSLQAIYPRLSPVPIEPMIFFPRRGCVAPSAAEPAEA